MKSQEINRTITTNLAASNLIQKSSLSYKSTQIQ